MRRLSVQLDSRPLAMARCLTFRTLKRIDQKIARVSSTARGYIDRWGRRARAQPGHQRFGLSRLRTRAGNCWFIRWLAESIESAAGSSSAKSLDGAPLGS